MLLLYIALIATLNLCIGYVLGATFGMRTELPAVKLPKVRRSKSVDDEPLVQAPSESPVRDAAPPPPAAPAETEEDQDLMSGLAAFQAQLAQMGEDLKDSRDDAEAFDANAKTMQDANHAYLESAQQQIDKLPEGDVRRDSAAAGVQEVGRISDEFDAIVDEGLEDEQTRAKLVDKSDELSEKVTEVRETQAEQDRAARSTAAAEAGLATLDSLLGQIDAALSDGAEPKHRTAVLVRRDAAEAEQTDEGLAQKLRAKVRQIVRDAAPDAGLVAAFDDDQILLMLEEGDIDAMTERIDTLRQQIEKTTFTVNGAQHSTTITCAIADLPGAESHDDVLECLKEAMDESARFGANRTFHHDGKFPTPAPPTEAAVEPQTVEL